jgi:2-amino-4-hydroxy-6-hydroxymethyldihydropteridine diphosphokinase
MTVFVAFGGNLGDPQAAFRDAAERIGRLPGVASVQASGLYRSRAVGGPADQPDYLNGALRLETSLEPSEMHLCLQEVQRLLGRTDAPPNAPRTIDLDLVLFGSRVVQSASLLVPHPRMHHRWFVLKPLADLNPEARHPVLDRSVREMLATVEADRPKLFLVGEEKERLAEARRAAAARRPDASISDCREIPGGVNFLRIGPFVAGFAFEAGSEAARALGGADWFVLLDGAPERTLVRAAGERRPAVDCRAASPQESVAILERFLDSLRAGEPVETRKGERDVGDERTALDLG